jgi:hypothetical protein
VDFGVLLDQRMDQEQVRLAVTDAVQEREEYLVSPDWEELAKGLSSGAIL